VQVDAVGNTIVAALNPVGHEKDREPVESWQILKARYWPAADEAKVELVTFPVRVIAQEFTVLLDAVKVGVVEKVTEVYAPACPPPGAEQLALPFAAIPVAKLLPEHCVGVEANAVAVAALPEVLLVMETGRSAATKVRKDGFPLEPLGAAKKLLAVWLPNPVPVKEPQDGSVPFEVKKVLAPPIAKRVLEEEW
jgi:hypothetical protein